MRTVLLIAAMAAFAAIGCSKKTAKPNAPDDTAPPKPLDSKKADGPSEKKASGEEKPNWLSDPRFNKKIGGDLPVNAADKPTWGLDVAPQPNAAAPQPAPAPMPMPQPPAVPAKPQAVVPAKPQAVVPAKPQAAAVTKNDINDVWIFIENVSQASGSMPPPDVVYGALIDAKSPAANLVKDGSLVLTGARTREGIWAFEKGAETRGGWVATVQGPEQVSAAEFLRLARGR